MLACGSSHIDMSVSPQTTGATHNCPLRIHQFSASRDAKVYGFRFSLQKERFSRRLKFVVSAELSKSLSRNIGLDSQTFQSRDVSKLPWIGPVPGDIAEVEAYCRIFRAAERLHNVLMETLCNPVTGECYVSYDFPSEEKQFLEDKIVSVLGCMVCLLDKGRDDVLSGRSALTTSFRVTSTDDKVPPLASFRSEMKRFCESLHVALENYLKPDDDRNVDVWRKLQRLKNVSYDSGFPRFDDFPCHMLFANWNPVYFSNVKEEKPLWKGSDVAFYKGGQVTEEGLKWLLERGFKTIVDLRAENVKDNFYQLAIDEAVSEGKIELVKLPVEVGFAPAMQQVEKFASLVLDSRRKPIYLHSKEGVWRTSAMVSRWRQYMNRCASNIISTVSTVSSKIGEILPKQDKKGSLLQQKLNVIQGSNAVFQDQVSIHKGNKVLSGNGAFNGSVPFQSKTSLQQVDIAEEICTAKFITEIDPLKSQIPPCNVFSRKEMSRFFKNKKVSPSTYKSKGWTKLESKSPVSTESCRGVPQESEIISTDSVSRFTKNRKLSNGSVNVENLSTKSLASMSNNASYVSVNGYGNGEKTDTLTKTVASSTYIGEKLDKKGNGEVSSDDAHIEGNMCSSATGVVRIQSRRKAEMFLVRTDGFSCTREKVTESSLAFTHPSTQQQMLMWKSTPKTVLLLKKLGQELMEEAKEVASFLYYQNNMNVLVEPDLHDIFARIPGFGFVQTFYSQDTSDLHERVDFVACLGGDGVILHASNLFRGAVPPVVSFNLGSLGFLTSHTFEDYREDLGQVIHGTNTLDGVYITLRMRLRCEIFRNGKAMPGKVFDVLNEVVVDRGSNPYISKIECYEHDRLITKVQGDGVIVATPTGSTAYSTAAGGSMVHPNVPCMLFTPICPHSLSFRPVILPDSARLELKIPEDARSNAWVSFDGKRRQQLSRGDSVRISMSRHPLPTVNKSDQTGDWFRSLIRCLNWNERLDQKAL